MNKIIILILIFLNLKFKIINSYYIVIDFYSIEKYENYLCGQLTINKTTIYPPCTSFYDAGKSVFQNNIIDYFDDSDTESFKKELIIYIIIPESMLNNKTILLNNQLVSFGPINNFCLTQFKFVDNNLNELNNETIPQLVIEGSKANQSFIETQEMDQEYNCNNNITFSFYNFKFLNWYNKPILNNRVFIDKPYGFNSTYKIYNCQFLNSNGVLQTSITYKDKKEIPLKRHYYFYNCTFDSLVSSPFNSMIFDKSPIGTCWSDLYYYDCIFRNSKISNSLLISSYLIEKLVMERTLIENNYMSMGFYKVFHMQTDINMDHLTFVNNSMNNIIHFGNIDKAIKTFSFQFKNSIVSNNLFLKSTSTQYLFNFDFNINIHFEFVTYVQDNSILYLVENQFLNNTLQDKSTEQSLIYINSNNSKLYFNNLFISNEFYQFLSSTSPYSISLSNNIIDSKQSIISKNTKVILFNNSILNDMKLLNSTIINLSSSDSNDNSKNPLENNNFDNNKKKLLLSILLSIFVTLFLILFILVILYKKSNIFNNFKKSSQDNNINLNTLQPVKSNNTNNNNNNNLDLDEDKAKVDNGSIPIDDAFENTTNKKKKIINEDEAELDY